MRITAAAGFAVALVIAVAAANPEAERNWGQWRGPHATGVALNGAPPLEWSEAKNVRWKVEIPGRGSSSPIVWGDRLFVLSAVPAGIDVAASHTPRGSLQPRLSHRFVVMALDRRTGRTLWERTANEAVPHESSHPDNGTWASASAITDGEHVIASFDSFGF
jgi:outer membrane protein assembly factor BamB